MSPGLTPKSVDHEGQLRITKGSWLYNAGLRILISAGEASGEMYGAELILALRRAWLQNRAELRSAGQFLRSEQALAAGPTQVPKDLTTLEFFGVGGDRMRAAGCDTVVDAKELAVVGITEILSRLPRILRLYRQLIAEADKRKPDLAIVIDSLPSTGAWLAR